MTAIRENEPRATSLGYDTDRFKLLAFVLSAALAGLAGALKVLVLGFETLTLAPIDCNLIDPSLLEDEEIAWLDEYHQRVRETLTPIVDQATAGWLAEVPQPLAPRVPLSPR